MADEQRKITVEEVADFFDETPEVETDGVREGVNLFDYVKRDGSRLTIKDFFKAYFHGRICRYWKHEIDIARARFHLIYEDNKFILAKLAHEMEALNELSNIDKNWKDVSTHLSTQETDYDGTTRGMTNDSHTDRRGISIADFQGSVDASQFSKVKSMATSINQDPSKPLSYLDPSTRVRTQMVHHESGENVMLIKTENALTNVNKSRFKVNSVSTSSNSSQDYYKFLNLRLPEIRRDFLSAFEIMFYF